MGRRIAFVGECMVELNAAPELGADVMRQTFGGDSLNACVYCRRALGRDEAVTVHYVTRLGDDPFSIAMLKAWRAEGLNTDLVEQGRGETAGLYAISLDAKGERSFHYWRGESAAKRLFTSDGAEALEATVRGFDALYFSGISLAILGEAGRERLLRLAGAMRAEGRLVAFDGNYRPRLWPSPEDARGWIARGYGAAALALPTFDDEAALFGDTDGRATAARLMALGCETIVVKRGGEPALVVERAAPGGQAVAVPVRVEVVDTTAAGDSFNGALLAARLTGHGWADAVRAGHAMAGRVIGARGAIVPHAVTAPATLGGAP